MVLMYSFAASEAVGQVNLELAVAATKTAFLVPLQLEKVEFEIQTLPFPFTGEPDSLIVRARRAPVCTGAPVEILSVVYRFENGKVVAVHASGPAFAPVPASDTDRQARIEAGISMLVSVGPWIRQREMEPKADSIFIRLERGDGSSDLALDLAVFSRTTGFLEIAGQP